MQDRNIVLDDSGLTAHKAGGMVEEDATADDRCRIDVGLEHCRGTALEVIGKILAAPLEQPMRQAMGLQGMETLEIEQGVDEARGRGVAVVYRDQVGAEGIAEIGI